MWESILNIYIYIYTHTYFWGFFFSSLLWQWTKLRQSASPATKEHRHCQCVYTLTLVTGLCLHYFLMIYQRAICSLSCFSVMKRQDSVPHLKWRTTDKNISCLSPALGEGPMTTLRLPRQMCVTLSKWSSTICAHEQKSIHKISRAFHELMSGYPAAI